MQGANVKKEARQNVRKKTSYVLAEDITCLSDYKLIASRALLIDIDVEAFRLRVKREDLQKLELKEGLTLNPILGQFVAVFLPHMGLDLDGLIVRTRRVDKDHFDVVVQFSKDIPLYWRECLLEMLPCSKL